MALGYLSFGTFVGLTIAIALVASGVGLGASLFAMSAAGSLATLLPMLATLRAGPPVRRPVSAVFGASGER